MTNRREEREDIYQAVEGLDDGDERQRESLNESSVPKSGTWVNDERGRGMVGGNGS